MAEVQSINPEPKAPLSQERADIALEAAWEAEACAVEALRILEDVGAEYLAARSLVVRLRDLACVTMDALQDEPLADVRKHLTGVTVPPDAVRAGVDHG